MSYGLLITNPDGYVKLDDTYPRYNVLQQGVCDTLYDTSFTTQSQMPLVFVRPSAYGDKILPLTIDLDSFRIDGANADLGEVFSVDYAVMNRFDFTSIPSGQGFNVLDGSSNLLFSSQGTFFNIDAIISYTLSTTPQTITVPAPEFGERYIAFMGHKGVRQEWISSYIHYWARAAALLSETQIEVSEREMPTQYSPTSVPGFDYRTNAHIIVTGYMYTP